MNIEYIKDQRNFQGMCIGRGGTIHDDIVVWLTIYQLKEKDILIVACAGQLTLTNQNLKQYLDRTLAYYGGNIEETFFCPKDANVSYVKITDVDLQTFKKCSAQLQNAVWGWCHNLM